MYEGLGRHQGTSHCVLELKLWCAMYEGLGRHQGTSHCVLELKLWCAMYEGLGRHQVSSQQKKPDEKEFECPEGAGNGNFADPVTCRRFYQVQGEPSYPTMGGGGRGQAEQTLRRKKQIMGTGYKP
uniref:Uncharacterized protein n=1 Tax=Timema genevievae TaxID=629358 RepID=A0A7R9PIQ9_TIMGE|nr:unnamed protein product [Timema genevievae]